MQTLKTEDYKLLQSLCKLTQNDMRRTLTAYLQKRYKTVHVTKDFIYAEGDIPIALVAHMDTVFAKPPRNIYYDRDCGVIWSPEGLGADDRAGIFSILKILQAKLRPTVIFTTDEEVGCLGAEAMVKQLPQAPSQINYIIQLDRRGTADCVFYDCDNPAFVEYVESFGFVESVGTLSDISSICPAWGIAGVNLSVGYEDEHSVSETLHVAPLIKTIGRVKEMITQDVIPEFKYIPVKYPWYNKSMKFSPYGFPIEEFQCAGCQEDFSEYEVFPALTASGEEVYYCPDCCVDHVQWCDVCNKGYEVESMESEESLSHRCPICRYKEEDELTEQYKNRISRR